LRIHILSPVVAWLLVTTPARAQVAAIDEARLVAELEARDPRAARLATEVAAARANVIAAGVRPNPSLAVEREEPFVDGRGVATNYLRLVVPLDVSGRRGLRVSAADADARGKTEEIQLARFELIVEGLRVFDDTAYARLYLEILTAERASLARAVESARQRAKAGDGSGYEVQRFELELAGFDDRIASAQLELRRSRVRLAALAGRPDTELDADSALVLPRPLPPMESLLAKAVVERGDYRAAKLRGDAATRRIQAAGRAWVPLPSFTAGAMTADLGERTGTGYVVGLALTVPIFDRGQGERAQANAERQAAAADARWLETQIPASVRLAYETLTARVAQAGAFGATQLERLDALLRAAETAFREGNASVVELLDAHRAARDVRLRALELRLEVARAKHDLELALGHRL
jgi:outer membrane protein, heavy metal efflux system